MENKNVNTTVSICVERSNIIDVVANDVDLLIDVLKQWQKNNPELDKGQQPVVVHNGSNTFDKLYTTSQIAKEFNVSARDLNKILKDLGIQKQKGNVWGMVAKYAHRGFECYITPTQRMWTEKGRNFILDLLG